MELTSTYQHHPNTTTNTNGQHRYRTYATGGPSTSGGSGSNGNRQTEATKMPAVWTNTSGGGGGGGGAGNGNRQTEMTKMPSISRSRSSLQSHSDNGELRALDRNLTALCEHIQLEGFNNGAFSDVIIHAMGSTYNLHRLILSRSSYFRNMLQGPWKEANAPVLSLHVDDKNVNDESIALALAYLYGHHPKLNDTNAFRVLAAASFLDLQDLCAICTDFIISELWTSNFLAYQVFAESQDYGIHGERVRSACWGYLCQSGAVELKEVLSKLSPQTLHALLTSNELWVLSEEKRFELALYTFLAKGTISEREQNESTGPDSSNEKGKNIADDSSKLETDLGSITLKDEPPNANDIPGEHTDNDVNFPVTNLNCREALEYEESASSESFSFPSEMRNICSYVEGPSQEDSYYQLNNYNWVPSDQRHSVSMSSSCDVLSPNEWTSCTNNNTPPLSWGGRVVVRRESKPLTGMSSEDYDAFVNIFEGGSLLYSNMSFEALMNVRKQLEEIGFPCKAVNDGLWLQMLLSQRVQEIGADTCKNCCLVSIACACRQAFGYSRGYYLQEHEQGEANVYITNSGQGEASTNGIFRPVRVHVRGPIDGLAGIGRGSTYVPPAAWPPTRFVFSRVPLGTGNRNGQQYSGSDDVENRAGGGGGDTNGQDLTGDGLTALVGLSEQSDRVYETDRQSRMVGSSMAGPSSSGVPVQMIDSPEHSMGIQWDNNATSSSISLDMKTPLCHFPPFRFAVEFQDVHRLSDGQVKHSSEVFYAGSLWKISVQAFSDEDTQGRRTLGLFLHRRKAEITDPLRKVYMYVDSREKVTARYQLICPSKREVMVFGSFKQTGTLLPKAPKGWGWRTALLFDELSDLLQNGALRVAAIVQLV